MAGLKNFPNLPGGGMKPYKGTRGPQVTDEMREAIIRRMNKGKGKGAVKSAIGGALPPGFGGGKSVPGNEPRKRKGTKWYGRQGTKWY